MYGPTLLHLGTDEEDHQMRNLITTEDLGKFHYKNNLILIIIIVIISILSTVAIQKYANLKTDTDRAVAESIAYNFVIASKINYILCSQQLPSANCINSGKIDCSTASAKLLLESLPSDVTISGGPSSCLISKNGTPAGKTVVIKTLSKPTPLSGEIPNVDVNPDGVN